jgi:hypothetical protein
MSCTRSLCALWGIEEAMSLKKIQIAPAMEAEQIWSGDQGIGFFA